MIGTRKKEPGLKQQILEQLKKSKRDLKKARRIPIKHRHFTANTDYSY